MPNVENGKFLHGSSGNVWFGGELLGNLKKIDVKVKGQFEDVNVAGDYATYSQYTGFSIEGSITLQKVDSMVLYKYKDAYQTGNIPPLNIVSRLTDSTGNSERTSLSGVVITEMSLINFEAKALCEEEIPIKASNYQILETL